VFTNNKALINKLELDLDIPNPDNHISIDDSLELIKATNDWCPPVENLTLKLYNFDENDANILKSLLSQGCKDANIVLKDTYMDKRNNTDIAWNELIQLIGVECSDTSAISFNFHTSSFTISQQSLDAVLESCNNLTKLELEGKFENMYDSLSAVANLTELRTLSVVDFAADDNNEDSNENGNNGKNADDEVECIPDDLILEIVESCTLLEHVEIAGAFEDESKCLSILAEAPCISKLKSVTLKGLDIDLEQICDFLSKATRLRALTIKADNLTESLINKIIEYMVQIDYEAADYPLLTFLVEASDTMINKIYEKYPDVTLNITA